MIWLSGKPLHKIKGLVNFVLPVYVADLAVGMQYNIIKGVWVIISGADRS